MNAAAHYEDDPLGDCIRAELLRILYEFDPAGYVDEDEHGGRLDSWVDRITTAVLKGAS